MTLPPLEEVFRGLENPKTWRKTSCATDAYNCLAWAAGEDFRRWDFGQRDFWPGGVRKKWGIAYLVHAYRKAGFEVCETEGRTVDAMYDKIVLYMLGSEGTHAAKLLDNGCWSSKLGDREDIEHDTPEALMGNAYGAPHVYMRRLKQWQGPLG